jgi:mRNA deadenylase 3'-5' endonuclease subunit Ccr4
MCKLVGFVVCNTDTFLKMSVTVVSFNVLAQAYALASRSAYSYCPEHALKWEHRASRFKDILESVFAKQHNASIICLQEVDQYEELFKPLLEQLGYASLYFQRPQKPDGILIAWKTTDFEVYTVGDELCTLNIDLNFLGKINKVYERSNVAMMAVLKHLESGSLLTVVNVHLYWNPAHADVRLSQSAYVMQVVEKALSIIHPTKQIHDLPLVACGDFNALPNSPVYHFLSGLSKSDATVSLDGASSLFLRGSIHEDPLPKLILDINLKKIKRWLRAVGFDVWTEKKFKDPKLTQLQLQDKLFDTARENSRILGMSKAFIQFGDNLDFL